MIASVPGHCLSFTLFLLRVMIHVSHLPMGGCIAVHSSPHLAVFQACHFTTSLATSEVLPVCYRAENLGYINKESLYNNNGIFRLLNRYFYLIHPFKETKGTSETEYVAALCGFLIWIITVFLRPHEKLGRQAYIMITCPSNVDPIISHFYIVELEFTGVYIIILFCAQT